MQLLTKLYIISILYIILNIVDITKYFIVS